MSIMPSSPILRTPARSEMVSPNAVNMRGTPATSAPETSAMRTALFSSSCILFLPSQVLRRTGCQVAAPHSPPPAQKLCNRHEEQNQANQEQEEIGWEIGLL